MNDQREEERLFPLPLTPLEYYYWCDDRPDYPMTFLVELTFSGEVEREPFCLRLGDGRCAASAAEGAVRREGRAAPLWVEGDGQPPSVDWAGGDVPISHPQGEYVDLDRSAGLRAWIRQAEAKTGASCCNSTMLAATGWGRSGCSRSSCSPITSMRPGAIRPPCSSRWSRNDSGAGELRRGCPGTARSARSVGRRASLGQTSEPVAGAAGGAGRRRPRFASPAIPGICHPRLGRRRPAPAPRRRLVTGRDLKRSPLARFVSSAAPLERRERRSRQSLVPHQPAGNGPHAGRSIGAGGERPGIHLPHPQCAGSARGPELFDSIRRETEAIRRFRWGLYFLGGLGVAMRLPGAIPWRCGASGRLPRWC